MRIRTSRDFACKVRIPGGGSNKHLTRRHLFISARARFGRRNCFECTIQLRSYPRHTLVLLFCDLERGNARFGKSRRRTSNLRSR